MVSKGIHVVDSWGPWALLANGCLGMTWGVAGKLDVGDNAVRAHMRNLYRKLQIHPRQDAIELAEGFGEGKSE